MGGNVEEVLVGTRAGKLAGRRENGGSCSGASRTRPRPPVRTASGRRNPSSRGPTPATPRASAPSPRSSPRRWRCCSGSRRSSPTRTASTSTSGRPRADDARRPVMVWIHGGAFMFGSGRHAVVRRHAVRARTATSSSSRSTTASARSASCTSTTSFGDDVRGLGQRRHPRPGRRARVGARQHRGVRRRPRRRHDLRRVGRRRERRHAARHCPRARGLFHAAIPQSGAASWVVDDPTTRPTIAARRASRSSASTPGDDSTRCSRRRPTRSSPRRPAVGRAHGGAGLPFQPVVDGTVLPEPPLDAIAAGTRPACACSSAPTATR